jgi:hypothetical protein
MPTKGIWLTGAIRYMNCRVSSADDRRYLLHFHIFHLVIIKSKPLPEVHEGNSAARAYGCAKRRAPHIKQGWGLPTKKPDLKEIRGFE